MNTFVTTVDLALAEKLRIDLLGQGFTLSSPPHTLFSARKKGVSCTLYCSGKLTVQGKGKEEFISFYLEPEILQDLSYTHPLSFNLISHIGVDEAGKGDFFGPLCIVALFGDKEGIARLPSLGVKDSKCLSDKTILKLSRELKKKYPYALVSLTPEKYNQLYSQFRNLNHLLAWAHGQAIMTLVKQTGCIDVWIDQFADESLVINALKRTGTEVHLTQNHRGEEDIVVAAASILARSSFLEGLEQLGATVGCPLPKGASAAVIETGKKLLLEKGRPIFSTLSKLHFKTSEVIFKGLACCLLVGSSFLSGGEYGLFNYDFIDPDHPIHVEGRWRGVGKAEFEREKFGHLLLTDSSSSLLYTQFLNPDNALSYGIGHEYLQLDWKKNPQFKEEHFHYALFSLGYISTTLDRWRWIVNGGFSIDVRQPTFPSNTVSHALLWGKYQFSEFCAIHVGMLGWYGLKSGYSLPLGGLDWHITPQWTATAIFPIDFSLNYAFNEEWSLETGYAGIGGPYRYPRQAGENHHFSTYSRGMDLSLKCRYAHFFHLDLGIGWDFGGWIFIRDRHNRHGHYYHFNSAPYAMGALALTF